MFDDIGLTRLMYDRRCSGLWYQNNTELNCTISPISVYVNTCNYIGVMHAYGKRTSGLLTWGTQHCVHIMCIILLTISNFAMVM